MAQLVTKTGSLELGFQPVEGDLAQLDRQFGWELYTQISTRVALRGTVDSTGEDRFRGEILTESLEEVTAFLEVMRDLIARYPAGRVEADRYHLGAFMIQMTEVVIRPLIQRWKIELDYWWHENRALGEPFSIQNNFPSLDELLDDWIAVRQFCRAVLRDLASAYGFSDVVTQLPAARAQVWGS
jgi:hypothetical protein